MRDDTCDLLLDSTTLTGTTAREMSSEGETTCDNSMVDLSQLRGKTIVIIITHLIDLGILNTTLKVY